MMRRFVSILCLLSLLLCLATATFWVRSYFIRDIVAFARTTGHSHTGQSILGRLHILSTLSGTPASDHLSHSSDRLSPNAIWNGGMSSYPIRPNWHLGCIVQTYTRGHMGFGQPFTESHRLIVIPYYYPTALFALPPHPLAPPPSPTLSPHPPGPLPELRLRPPRQQRPLPRMRHSL